MEISLKKALYNIGYYCLCAIIIAFNVRPEAIAKMEAEKEGVEIKMYSIIYNAIEDVEAAMKGMLDPVLLL